ncbi:MAG: hypothetical protein ACRENE_22275 [Polyangiaceae bacterium]
MVLDTRRGTFLYWASVALIVAGLFIPRLLPCVDYPQHLGLSDVARRLRDASAPEQATFRLNYFTYNGLFHTVVAWLSRALPVEMVGRALVVSALVAKAGGVLALVRVTRRPSAHAALFLPVLFSFALGWGFVNYVLSTAIAVWALVLVARAVVEPSLWLAAAIAALGLACGFAHVLGLIVLCVASAALALELAWRVAPIAGSWTRRLAWIGSRAGVAGLPLLAGCVYCILVYRRQYAWAPRMYQDPVLEGTGPTLGRKLLGFASYTLDLFPDATGRVLLWATLVTMMGAAVLLAFAPRDLQGSKRGSPPAFVAPLFVLTVAYAVTPTVLMGTHLIFQRLGQFVVLGAVLAMPAFPPSARGWAERWIPTLAVLSSVNVVLHCGVYAWETNDASRVIDELPPGRPATAVIWDPGTRAFRKGTLTHLAAYYAARKHGEWAFAFARYLSLPVRFRPGAQPAWPTRGWEFNASAYDARCKYARAFPLVIVEAPRSLPEDASGEAPLRRLVFRQDADAVKLLSHHGRFWAFDTAGLPDDGTS